MQTNKNRHLLQFRKPLPKKVDSIIPCMPNTRTPKQSHLQMINVYTKTIKRSSNSERKMSIKQIAKKTNNTITYDDEPTKYKIKPKQANHNFIMAKAMLHKHHQRRGSIANKISREGNSKLNNTSKLEHSVPKYESEHKSIKHKIDSKLPSSLLLCYENSKPFNGQKSNKLSEKILINRREKLLLNQPSLKLQTISSPLHNMKNNLSFKNQHRILIKSTKHQQNKLCQALSNRTLLNCNLTSKRRIEETKLTKVKISNEDKKCIQSEIAKLFSGGYNNQKKPPTPTQLSDTESIVLYDSNNVIMKLNDKEPNDHSISDDEIENDNIDNEDIPESTTPLLVDYKYPSQVKENQESNLSLTKLHLLKLVSSKEIDAMKNKIHTNLRREVVAQSIRKRQEYEVKEYMKAEENPMRNKYEINS